MSRHSSSVSFFAMHPIGGSVMPYVSWAKQLEGRCNFYGIEARGLHGEIPDDSMVDAASAYADAIMRVQPDGVFHLGGWSLGGGLAFEVSRILRAEGKSVAPLVMLDTNPGWLEEIPDPAASAAWFVSDVCSMQRIEVPLAFQKNSSSYEEIAEPEHVVNRLVELGVIPSNLMAHVVIRMRSFVAMSRAFGEYLPRASDVDACLFSVVGHASLQLNTWSKFALGNVKQFVIDDCDHYSILQQPSIDFVTQTINKFVIAEK